eukprot:5082807-Amphidinium_carterae.2
MTGHHRRWGNTIDIAIFADLLGVSVRLTDIASSEILFESVLPGQKTMDIGYFKHHFVAGKRKAKQRPPRCSRILRTGMLLLLLATSLWSLGSIAGQLHRVSLPTFIAVSGGAPKAIAGTTSGGPLRPFQQIGYCSDGTNFHRIQNIHDLAAMSARHRALPPDAANFRGWPRAFNGLRAGDREALQNSLQLLRTAREQGGVHQRLRTDPVRTPIPDNFVDDIAADMDTQLPCSLHVVANPVQLAVMELQHRHDLRLEEEGEEEAEGGDYHAWEDKGVADPLEMHATCDGHPLSFASCIELTRAILVASADAPKMATGDRTLRGTAAEHDQEGCFSILNPHQLGLMTSLYTFQAHTRALVRRNQMQEVIIDTPSLPPDATLDRWIVEDGDNADRDGPHGATIEPEPEPEEPDTNTVWQLKMVRAILDASIGAPKMAENLCPLPGEVAEEFEQSHVSILNPHHMRLMTAAHCYRVATGRLIQNNTAPWEVCLQSAVVDTTVPLDDTCPDLRLVRAILQAAVGAPHMAMLSTAITGEAVENDTHSVHVLLNPVTLSRLCHDHLHRTPSPVEHHPPRDVLSCEEESYRPWPEWCIQNTYDQLVQSNGRLALWYQNGRSPLGQDELSSPTLILVD